MATLWPRSNCGNRWPLIGCLTVGPNYFHAVDWSIGFFRTILIGSEYLAPEAFGGAVLHPRLGSSGARWQGQGSVPVQCVKPGLVEAGHCMSLP